MSNMSQYFMNRSKLKTGDMVLFDSGYKTLTSIVIKLFQRGGANHVGMVLRDPCFDVVYLLESTSINSVADVTLGKVKNGVSLVPLSQKVKKYKGRVLIRPLNKDIDQSRMEKLKYLLKMYRSKEYEKNLFELARAAWGKSKGENTTHVFCSELFVVILKDLGLFLGKEPANAFSPKRLQESDDFDLKEGYAYNKPFDIK